MVKVQEIKRGLTEAEDFEYGLPGEDQYSYPQFVDGWYHAFLMAFEGDPVSMATTDFETFVKSRPKVLKQLAKSYEEGGNIPMDDVYGYITQDVLSYYEQLKKNPKKNRSVIVIPA